MKRRIGRIAYGLMAIAYGAVWFVMLLTAAIVVPLLSFTPIGPPAIVAFAMFVRMAAVVEVETLARFGGPRLELPPQVVSRGYFKSAMSMIRDVMLWRQVAFLALRAALGWTFAVSAIAMVLGGLNHASLTLFPSRIDDEIPTFTIGDWHFDPHQYSAWFAPAGIAEILLGILIAVALGYFFERMAIRLLGACRVPGAEGLEMIGDEDACLPGTQGLEPGGTRRSLVWHATFSVVVAIVLVTIAGMMRSGFWPSWPILVFAMLWGVHAAWYAVGHWPTADGSPRTCVHPLALHTAWVGVLELFLIAIWANTGLGYFWPAWTAFGLALTVLMHEAGQRVWHRYGPTVERIEALTTSRADVVSAQEEQLRRIERDLHDGAQARIVSLGMTLGLASQRMADDPERARELVAEAQASAKAALVELRDLARGISPPVLADRGLGPAIESLTAGSRLPVTIGVNVPERLPSAVERAAYFVVAECLANAGKHAGASTGVQIGVRMEGSTLVVEVRDDGPGGADASGSGLTGLRQRVEALDGRLSIVSPAGGPTCVRADVPTG